MNYTEIKMFLYSKMVIFHNGKTDSDKSILEKIGENMNITEKNKLLAIKSIFIIGIILDGLFALDMALVGFFGTTTFLTSLFTNITVITPEYQYALISAAGTMWGWTVLLFWALKKPKERKEIALITAFPVVAILLIGNLIAGSNGLISLLETILQVGTQICIFSWLSFAYWINRD